MVMYQSIAQATSSVQAIARRPRSLASALSELDQALQDGDLRRRRAIGTGFSPLDRSLAGGLKPGELLLVGGAQGLGKTTLTLQMARNMAVAGARVLYVCYEHDESFLLTRLLAMESLNPRDDYDDGGIRLRDIVQRIEQIGAQDNASIGKVISSTPALGRSWSRLAGFAERLLLLRGSGMYTDLDALRDYVTALRTDDDAPFVLFIDYLQKVPTLPESPSEEERVTRVVEGLKDLALTLGIGVVAVVAADKSGIQAQRLRLHHLRGSSALLYEADVILILNDKYRIVTKTSITFNTHEAQAFRTWVVCTLEKNRSGRDLIDLEFRKRFDYSCFNPDGRIVNEVLIDERILVD